MHRTRTTRAQQQAETRARLLDAAQTVLSRMGYHGASLDLVSAEAGYSKGAVYSNFDSKEALFLELLRIHMDRDLSELERIMAMEPKALFDANARWVEGLNATAPDCPALLIELQLHARRSPEFAKSFYALQDRKYHTLANIIVRFFQAAGREPPMDPFDLARLLDASMNGLSIQRPTASPGETTMVGSILARLINLIASAAELPTNT